MQMQLNRHPASLVTRVNSPLRLPKFCAPSVLQGTSALLDNHLVTNVTLVLHLKILYMFSCSPYYTIFFCNAFSQIFPLSLTHTHFCCLGKFVSNYGASSCDSCAAGQFASSTNQTLCSLCLRGRYQSATGQSSCAECEKGDLPLFLR